MYVKYPKTEMSEKDSPDPTLEIEMAQVWAQGLVLSILAPDKALPFLSRMDPHIVVGTYLWLLSEVMDGPTN